MMKFVIITHHFKSEILILQHVVLRALPVPHFAVRQLPERTRVHKNFGVSAAPRKCG